MALVMALAFVSSSPADVPFAICPCACEWQNVTDRRYNKLQKEGCFCQCDCQAEIALPDESVCSTTVTAVVNYPDSFSNAYSALQVRTRQNSGTKETTYDSVCAAKPGSSIKNIPRCGNFELKGYGEYVCPPVVGPRCPSARMKISVSYYTGLGAKDKKVCSSAGNPQLKSWTPCIQVHSSTADKSCKVQAHQCQTNTWSFLHAPYFLPIMIFACVIAAQFFFADYWMYRHGYDSVPSGLQSLSKDLSQNGKHKRASSGSFDTSRRSLSSDSLDVWKLQMEDITLHNKLAAGSQSQVYRGSFKGKDVAVKILSFTVEVMSIEWAEVSILTQLYHPHIVKVRM
jgi:hypothetical protein